MNQLTAEGIVLSRTNYGEADRIIKLLTPDSGKLSLMARGVRKPKSKLAGGIELFSVSSLTYIKGRGDLSTLISTRLEKHYGNIVKQLDRVQLGYELIKQLDRATEDQPEAEYFALLAQAFAALDASAASVDLIRFWFQTQLVALAGHTPNLRSDVNGDSLQPDGVYSFDYDAVSFAPNDNGRFTANHIKFLRIAFAGNPPATLQHIDGVDQLLKITAPLTQTMLTTHIRI